MSCLLLLLAPLSACRDANAAVLVVHPGTKELTLGLPFRAVAQLSVEVRPAGTHTRLEWSSSDTGIAVVDERGFVTALAPGTARISVRDAESGARSVCTLKVRTLPQELSIRANRAELRAGRKLNLSPKLSPAPYIPTLYKTITWSSSRTDVATVDARGRVTAVSPGTAEITGQTVNGLTQVCVVEVRD
ncbi:MAG: Ig-like domain-containing protein [Oscillospiraceae bacterium]|nr:Ig-like domain-containing protein [Oscillospiraceae bacterium]